MLLETAFFSHNNMHLTAYLTDETYEASTELLFY